MVKALEKLLNKRKSVRLHVKCILKQYPSTYLVEIFEIWSKGRMFSCFSRLDTSIELVDFIRQRDESWHAIGIKAVTSSNIENGDTNFAGLSEQTV